MRTTETVFRLSSLLRRLMATLAAPLVPLVSAACDPSFFAASLDVNIVRDEGFVLVHARDPSLSCTCPDLDFADIDICLQTTDAPTCDCPSDETLPTAPCLDELRVALGDVDFASGGSQHSFSFFTSGVDPFAGEVVTHLAGCGGRADIAVPPPAAPPGIVSARRGDDGALTLELDQALQRIDTFSSDGGGQHCGAAPSSTVLMRARPDEQTIFVARLLQETGAVPTPYGVARMWFQQPSIFDVAAVTTLPDGALALPLSRASVELTSGAASFAVSSATVESAILRDRRVSIAVRVDEPDPAAPPAVAVDAFRVEVDLDGGAPRIEVDIGAVTYLVNEPALDRLRGGVDVAEHFVLERVIDSARLVDIDGNAAEINAERFGLTISGPVLVSVLE